MKAIHALPEHLLQSGLVTEGEMKWMRDWIQDVVSARRFSQHEENRKEVWPGSELPFRFSYGGRDFASSIQEWLFEASVGEQGVGFEKSVLVWKHRETGLALRWDIKLWQDYPAVDWLLSFEHQGFVESLALENIQSLSLQMGAEHPGGFGIHGANGGRSKPDDLMPFTVRLGDNGETQELRLGTTGNTGSPEYYACHSSDNHLPFFNLETPDQRGICVGVGWSGRWLATIAASGGNLAVEAGLPMTRFTLQPGEKVRAARILLLFWEGEPLHGQNMQRQLLHRNYMPLLNGSPADALVSVNTCFTHHGKGTYLDCGEDELKPLIKPFSEMGIESFIIDAGWWECDPDYNDRIGTYDPSPAHYPQGLKPLADPLLENGIRFGVWMPVEVMDPANSLVREHPDWVENNRWELPPWRLRMEHPEARGWLLHKVDKLMREEGVSCYRQDFYTLYSDTPDGVEGLMELRHIAGMYTLLNELRAQYPSLLMEGCCAGGRRIDLETIGQFHWHQKSDRWFDPESDQCGLFGANLFLPGGCINVPVDALDNYGIWSAFAGQLCLAWHPLDSDFPMESARRQVELYKELRPLLHGDFYPLTECKLDAEWLGFQFHHNELNRGVAYIFRRACVGIDSKQLFSDTFLLQLKGLADDNQRFIVKWVSCEQEQMYSGSDLKRGIAISITGEKGAEIIQYKRFP